MEQLKLWLAYEFFGIAVWVYGAAFGAILAGFLAKKIVSLILNRFLKTARKTRFQLDDILISALMKPLEWGALLGGLFIALNVLPIPEEPVNIRKFIAGLTNGFSIWLIVWFAIRLVDGLMDLWTEKAAKTETKLDDQLVPIVRRSAKVFLFIIGLVLVLQNMGYSVGSLLAGLGIGGVALAMASKDTVANLFGSLVIFLDKPFQIGDWIEIGDVEGTVEVVGLRTTRVRTFANSLVTVPNMLFTTEAINNWTRMKKRRIKMTVGVTYSSTPDQVEDLVNKIRGIVEADEKILNDFYLVHFDNFGPSSLDILVYCFTSTTIWIEYMQAKQDLMLRIMRAVEEMGLSFAFPSRSIYVESMPGEPEALTGQRPK